MESRSANALRCRLIPHSHVEQLDPLLHRRCAGRGRGVTAAADESLTTQNEALSSWS